MDTKEIVMAKNFSEHRPGEVAERAVNIKHNLLLYFGQKFGEPF
jgi:hypothetical protein